MCKPATRITVPVSIDDVAKEAGVSRGTVSHVLNGNEQARIAKATQERVWQVVKRMGYQPNRMARSLGRRRTDTIGLIVYGLLNPFYLHLQEAIEAVALSNNLHLFSDTSTPLPVTNDHQAKLRGWPMDGVIMWANASQTIRDYFGRQTDGLHVVYLSGEPRNDLGDVVYFDVYKGAKEAMKHLLAKGHRRIAYVYPYPWIDEQPGEPRRKAYTEACIASGIELKMLLMSRHIESRRAGMEMGLTLAEMPSSTRPTALLCFNDCVAEGVLFGLRRHGLRIPDDVAIVGFDGIEESQYLDIPLTTVMLPAAKMGQEALRVLIRRINSDGAVSADSTESLAIATELLVGKTT